MKKTKPSRLTLNRETLHRLDEALGGLVGGAAPEPPSSQACCPLIQVNDLNLAGAK